MFYSETLLQKTGPLAKVWLAANVERKLTKGDCVKHNITRDVRNIVSDDQAPLALRLTSQLLLGVVRIYSRKARYLLDDCNEALVKIKLVSTRTIDRAMCILTCSGIPTRQCRLTFHSVTCRKPRVYQLTRYDYRIGYLCAHART